MLKSSAMISKHFDKLFALNFHITTKIILKRQSFALSQLLLESMAGVIIKM